MFRRASFVALILLLLSANSSLAATTYTVKMVSGVYRPKNLTVALGDSVQWKNKTGKTRTATPLYQYAWSSVSVAPGHMSSPVRMTQAGTFPYRSATGKRMKGTITVPMTVDPPAGNTATFFTLTMGTEKTPGVMVHDVYVRQNGGSWQVRAVTAEPTVSIFFPSTGSWDIHSRLRWQLGGASSEWTPIVTVEVF
jgi:plastocyanin